MYIAITGTPGTGKSTLTRQLQDSGKETISVFRYSKEQGFIIRYDEEMDSYEVDIQALDNHLKNRHGGEDIVFISGHLSHLLSVPDMVIVLRCNPNIIRQRLEERGYPESKIRENMEAEAVDVILVESLDNHDAVFEIECTDMQPEEVVNAVIEITEGKHNKYEPGRVDWSEVVLGWY